MNPSTKELALKKPVINFLKGLGCDKLKTELTLVDRGVDVFALKSSPRIRSYAVELKMNDWQKALRQAAIYQLCADYCYVAMPYQKAQRLDRGVFREAGVGLLSVNLFSKDVAVLSAARRSTVKRDVYSDCLAKSVTM